MYVLFIAIAVAIGAWLIARGARRQSAGEVAGGAAVLVGTFLLFALMSFWGEMLWFDHVGYSGRFWTVVWAVVLTALCGAAAGELLVLLVTWPARRRAGQALRWPAVTGAVLGAVWGLVSWDAVLMWLNRVETGTREPILGLDTGFYMFTLPLVDRLYWLAFALAVIALLGVFLAMLSAPGPAPEAGWIRRPGRPVVGMRPVAENGRPILEVPPSSMNPAQQAATAPPAGSDTAPPPDRGAWARPLFVALGAFTLVLAAGRFIDAFHLLYSRWGVVYGPGWTDVHVRLPAYYIVGSLLALLAAVLFVAGASPRFSSRLAATRGRLARSVSGFALAAGAVWVTGLLLLPLLFQWLRVAPNEITAEKPYLANNIAFTRKGFDLEKVEERPFAPSGAFTPQLARANAELLEEIRLWDPRALQAVLKQFQEIRLYYEMADLDVDRYVMGDQYRQVMVAAREMEQMNLPAQSRTFVNRRFKYTHGYGAAMASVHDFTADGLPNLLIKDLPPVAQYPNLAIDRPEIYYGEHTDGYVIADTEEPEFDYPLGEQNVYTRYEGHGGVELTNFWRKLVYGWKLGGTRLLFSGYPTDRSRVLYHRNIQERVAALAPFLDFDHDPYVVVVGGRLKWIVDAYTTSSYYPYSEPYFSGEVVEKAARNGQKTGAGPAKPATRDVVRANVASYLHGANYVRNAVKAVVDAYDGDVTFYVFAPDDPIIQVWSRAFPGMFRPRSEMPRELYAHVRYPEGFLLAQGLVYAKYHMTIPEVFYNQEDLWIRATERYYDEIRPVDPYYVMWKPPGAPWPQFSLIQPFTPKNKQVLIGWIAGLCDPQSYGRLIAYRFPKEQWVLGTQQVDTKIDQDPVLSAQLSLWDQRGSRVIRGNVLVIPIDRTLLYVEPIYLQAEAAAYPELRVVVLMHGEQMAYAPTFDEALRKLLSGEPPAPAGAGLSVLAPEAGPRPEAAERASRALDGYLRALGQKRFEDAAAELRALDTALRDLSGQPTSAPPPAAPPPTVPPGEAPPAGTPAPRPPAERGR